MDQSTSWTQLNTINANLAHLRDAELILQDISAQLRRLEAAFPLRTQTPPPNACRHVSARPLRFPPSHQSQQSPAPLEPPASIPAPAVWSQHQFSNQNNHHHSQSDKRTCTSLPNAHWIPSSCLPSFLDSIISSTPDIALSEHHVSHLISHTISTALPCTSPALSMHMTPTLSCFFASVPFDSAFYLQNILQLRALIQTMDPHRPSTCEPD